MACSRFVWRFCLWWCLLLCVLPTVEAASKSVNLPSLSDQVSKGSATYADSVLTMSTAIEGEFIPGPTKNVPVRGILGGTTFGLNTIVPKAKSLLKGGLVAVAAGFAFDKLIEGVGWVMDEGAISKKVDGPPVTTNPAAGEIYFYSSGNGRYSTVLEACTHSSSGYGSFPLSNVHRDGSTWYCTATFPNGTTADIGVAQGGGDCPAGSSLSSTGSCVGAPKLVPVTPSDIDGISVDQFINAQNSDFVKDLLHQSCAGSNNPNGCYQALRKESLNLKGPASVDAGTVTTTTTHPNSDGTVSTSVTNVNTKYNIVYGPTNYNYTKNTNSTTTTDGKPGDTTTEEEQPADDPADDPEDKPDDDVAASPCTGEKCDGPAYKKLYEKSKETKESKIDGYATRVAAIPLFAAVTGYFTVSANAGCPVWETPVNFDVYGASFSYDLVFNFHCQGWFTAIASYASTVMMIVCSFLAFRQAFLD